jgi:hypothetical protein
MSETPRTDEHLRMKAENGQVAVVNREFARQLERENNKLRILLDKARRGMTASELKSAHNGICILLEKTKMLDKIKAGLEEGEK